MRSHLLGEYREVEETAPPPQGTGPAALGTVAGGHRCHYPLFSLENPASPSPPSPRTNSSYLFTVLRHPLPSRLRHPLPIHSLQEPRPLNRRRGHWHSPEPIATSSLQCRPQSASAGGGASPMSFRLLPGPQDPFCLERARLGLSSRHFRGEAPSSSGGLRLGSSPWRLGFSNFPSPVRASFTLIIL
jgi:hypothetical protein